MYPELFRIGNFPVNTYGALLAVGLVLALMVAARLASNDGLPKERIYDLGLWTIIGGLVGSKILMYFTEENFKDNLRVRQNIFFPVVKLRFAADNRQIGI